MHIYLTSSFSIKTMNNPYRLIEKATINQTIFPEIDKPLIKEFLLEIKEIFQKENQLIHLPENKIIIFVGDTHGDFKSSIQVLKNYLNKNTIIVFLGDYVDRAPEKLGDIKNILYLFHMKIKNKNLILLRGNHEDIMVNTRYGFKDNVMELWDEEIWALFNNVFASMPLAVTTKKIIGLHGGLPEIKRLEQIKNIPKGLFTGENKFLDQLLWSDSLDVKVHCGRHFEHPKVPNKTQGLFDVEEGIIEKENRGVKHALLYGKTYFEEIISKIKKEILIRSHNPEAKGLAFNKRCITLFTSSSYANCPEMGSGITHPIKGRIIAICPANLKNKEQIIIKKLK